MRASLPATDYWAPGGGGVAGRQGGGLSEGQAGSGRQAAQRTPPPREGAYLFLAVADEEINANL